VKQTYWLAQEDVVREALKDAETLVTRKIIPTLRSTGRAEENIHQAAGELQKLGIHGDKSSGESEEVLTPVMPRQGSQRRKRFRCRQYF
jgi:hypothetical protein